MTLKVSAVPKGKLSYLLTLCYFEFSVRLDMKRNGNLTRQQILKSLKDRPEILRKYRVRRIGLFGSYATGKQTPRSDIDFLVDFEEPTFDNFIGLNAHLERLFKKKIDLITDGSLSPYIKPYVEKQVRWHEVE